MDSIDMQFMDGQNRGVRVQGKTQAPLRLIMNLRLPNGGQDGEGRQRMESEEVRLQTILGKITSYLQYVLRACQLRDVEMGRRASGLQMPVSKPYFTVYRRANTALEQSGKSQPSERPATSSMRVGLPRIYSRTGLTAPKDHYGVSASSTIGNGTGSRFSIVTPQNARYASRALDILY